MVSISEKTKRLYNEIAPKYKAFPFHYHPEHRQLFIDQLPANARILDAGCAGGRDTKFFSDLGLRVTGVDFSSGQISEAQSKYPGIDFREADLLNLVQTFPRGEFDGVYTYATLDHILRRDIPRAIRNFNFILKNSGVLLVCTRKGKGVLWTNDSYSVGKKRRFTLIESEELENLLSRNGFEIEYFESFPSVTRANMEFNLALCRKHFDLS